MQINKSQRPILLEGSILLCFQVIRLLWTWAQALIWHLSGVSRLLHEVRNPMEYHRSAQVLNVQAKYCFDKIFAANTIKHFLLRHEKFVHPNYVLKDEVSLYNITKTEAIFVEAPPGVEVWHLKYGAFLKQAQFDNAVRIIRMPLYAFHQLAEDLGDPKAKLIFVDFTPRSGSTMLCQIFQATGKCVSFSEPHFLSDIFLDDVKPDGVPDVKRKLQSGVRLLCKPRSTGITLAFMMKTVPVEESFQYLLREKFPNSSFMLLYRNPRESLISLGRMTKNLNTKRLLDMAMRVYQKGARQTFVANVLDKGSIKPYAAIRKRLMESKDWSLVCSFYMWSRCLKCALALQDKEDSRVGCTDIKVAAIKYEDILANPSQSLTTVLERCGLPLDLLPAAIKGMENDSQANSPVARASVAGNKSFEDPTGTVAEDITAISKFFGTPDYMEDFRLWHTITKP